MGLWMKKALNFDLNTKKYEEYTGKHAPTAYYAIKKYLKRNGFVHRQGSGYISIDSLNDSKIFAIIHNMSFELEWLGYCVKQIDVTNIGKQHSLIDVVNKTFSFDDFVNLNDIEKLFKK